jgi:hypothetical protein
MQQFHQPSVDVFGDGSFIPETEAPMPIDDMGFPTLGFDAFMFSENFEWDLANLWNQDFSPGSQVE